MVIAVDQTGCFTAKAIHQVSTSNNQLIEMMDHLISASTKYDSQCRIQIITT